MAPSPTPEGTQTFNLCLAFTILASVTVFARLFTRSVLVQNFGKDDYLMLFSWIFGVVCSIMIMLQTVNGLGHHISDLSPQDLSTVLQFFYWSIPFYYASLSLTKLAIVFQTLRFVAPSQKRSRLSAWIMIGIVTCYMIYTLATTFAICDPPAAFWDKSVSGHCLDYLALWFVNAAINIVTDIGILIIPIRVIVSIQLPKKQKLWLVGVFAVGGIVCITSILRLQSLYVVSVSTDPTFDNAPAAYWSDIEMNIAMVCCNLPTLRPLLSRFSSQFRGSSYGALSRNTGNQIPGTPGLMNSRRQTLRASRASVPLAAARNDDGGFPLKNIMVTTEIKQDYQEHEHEQDHEKHSSSSLDGSPSSIKGDDFV